MLVVEFTSTANQQSSGSILQVQSLEYFQFTTAFLVTANLNF